MKERYVLQVFFDNQQSAVVAGELVAKNLGIVVDILHHREITTIHPPLQAFSEMEVNGVKVYGEKRNDG